MPDIADIQLRLYSPRWGEEEICSFRLEREQATFELRGKTASCTWNSGSDPIWSGYDLGGGNSVENILGNDKIYPPSIFVRALESAWEAWKDGRLDTEGVQQEIDKLCEWVNEAMRCRPKTEFWRKMF